MLFSTLLAPPLHFAPVFFVCWFVYFCGDGSRVCSSISHSAALVTGLASTPPHPGTRAPPGARVLHCPIVFTPAQSCLLLLFTCPHNLLCRSHLGRKPRPLASRSPCGSVPPHLASARTPLYPAPRGRSSVTWLLLFSLGPALCALRSPWGRFHEEPPHFSHLRENASQPFMESVLGGSSAAGSTCSRQVAGSLATPRRRFPARPTTQLSRGVHSEDALRPLLAGQLGPGKRRRAPRPRPPGGSLAGVLSRPPEVMGSRSSYRRGACLLS